MTIRLTNHGVMRLFERVHKKATIKTNDTASKFLQKVLEKGVVTVNDASQCLIKYADNLYVFKKECEHLVFVTVKTCQEYRRKIYMRGVQKLVSSKKDFLLCA